jgi:UDP-GlcNAc3NAcA epimerase
MAVRKIATIVGARPQFIKAAAVSRALASFNETAENTFDEKIIHTGQHYDDNMSRVFFDELKIPRPYKNLEVGSGPHGAQTGAMLEKLEQEFMDINPDAVLIYGDTNSTLAGALAGVKMHIPVVHVEAGLRSFNRRMPEEINRIVADSVSTLLFCPTDTAVSHLGSEGVRDGVYNVGDVMYDSVLFNASLAEQGSDVLDRLGLEPNSFFLATIHRAENTDDPVRLNGILEAFARIETPIVLPLHPRTRKTLGAGLERIGGAVQVIDPVPYLDMLMLEKASRLILTDSGGVQKEAYWFSSPCVTLRDETEWVELVDAGCNRIVGADTQTILDAVAQFESSGLPADCPSDLYGDGHCAGKIVSILDERLSMI